MGWQLTGWEGVTRASGQGFLTRSAHADAVQVFRPYKVEMLWPSDIKFFKDGSIKLGQLDVPEQL